MQKINHPDTPDTVLSLQNSGFELTTGELAFFNAPESIARLPVRIPEYYRKLILSDKTGALRKMAVPAMDELKVLPFETADPLHEESWEPVSRCIHRYKDRVLLLVTDQCALYCRYCFRRRFTGDGTGGLGKHELEKIRRYLVEHPEVHEVILSGGDPLTLNDQQLQELFNLLQDVPGNLVFRLSTRMPSVLPGRISPRLVELLGRIENLWLVLHVNHPAEFTDEFRKSVAAFADAGIPMVSQTVLLRGVNDSKQILTQLFHQLLESRIKPYYLFQGDLAAGTSHFRVNLKEAVKLYRNLRMTVSGLALPSFAVDLPAGGGKILLNPDSITGEEEDDYLLKDYEGRIFRYPVER